MPTRATKHFVIAYNITHNSKRSKLANMLLDYGTRVQHSVFEADLSVEDVQEILKRSANYMEHDDSLRVYPLCKTYAKDI